MCDTFVALPEFTGSRHLIFGKNSDREPNEAQSIERHLAQEYPPGTGIKTTYIEIPQARQTHEILISRPFHMWGAEMGANDRGLVIGNEAVFTKVPMSRKNRGLTGMDLLRLALERTSTALQAIELITEMIAEYSQDACGGYLDRNFYYHNSFILADSTQAFVLETAGKHWAAQKVKGFRSISNGLTIENEFDLSSEGLIDYARQQGWVQKGEDFNFRKAFSDRFYTYFSMCSARQALSLRRGLDQAGHLGVSDAMDILRTHGLVDAENFDPALSRMNALCMHATGLRTPSQTTASMIAELIPERPLIFFTGTAAPCLSVFLPFFFPGKTLLDLEPPGKEPDASLWWKHEKLHRAVIIDYGNRAPQVHIEIKKLEEKIATELNALASHRPDIKELDRISARYMMFVLQQKRDLLAEMSGRKRRFSLTHPLYSLYRTRIDRAVGL
ncbi:MAG: C69 family dipeptidase [Spirochaetales bacterium]|nr:C69 family dipeptidase [Spirochaetales bacterium]